MTTRLTRRETLAGFAALLPGHALAQPGLDPILDAAGQLDQIHSLVIARHGQILEAEAIRGPPVDRPVNVKSVSKSLVSALTGIAIARGELTGPDQPVAPLLRRAVPRRADKRVQDITVGDLLSMRSGLQQVSGDAYAEWVGSKHLIYEALSKPMVADPGTNMLYSTASYHILGAVLARVADKDLLTLARERLGDPLGIEIPSWPQDPQGLYLGGNDMRLSPLAMIRFGETYRNQGSWRARQVIPQDWIEASWTPYTASTETGHGYGYGWFTWDPAGTHVAYARGYGGQMIWIAPDLAVTVAVTSNPGLPATLDGHLGALNRLLEDSILPTIAALP